MEIPHKTALVSTIDLQKGDTFCARSAFTPSEIEEGEYAILPYFLVKDLITEGFLTDETFTESKRKVHICNVKHPHLIQGTEKHKSTMFMSLISRVRVRCNSKIFIPVLHSHYTFEFFLSEAIPV